MKSRALDPAAALELVRAARPQAEPNAAFLKQLDVLHTELEASRRRDAQRMGGPVAPAKPPRLVPSRARRGRRRGPAPRASPRAPVATVAGVPRRAGAPTAGPAPRPSPRRRRGPTRDWSASAARCRRRRPRGGASPRPRWNASRGGGGGAAKRSAPRSDPAAPAKRVIVDVACLRLLVGDVRMNSARHLAREAASEHPPGRSSARRCRPGRARSVGPLRRDAAAADEHGVGRRLEALAVGGRPRRWHHEMKAPVTERARRVAARPDVVAEEAIFMRAHARSSSRSSTFERMLSTAKAVQSCKANS